MNLGQEAAALGNLGPLPVDSFKDALGGRSWLLRGMSFCLVYRKPLGKGGSSCPFKCSQMKAAMTVNRAIL